MTVQEIHGRRVFTYDGPVVQGEPDALDVIAATWTDDSQADWVVIPADLLTPEFFALSSGVAGAIAQKFVNYGIGLAVMGDMSKYPSEPLAALVRESNRGRHTWFVSDVDELAAQLERLAAKDVAR